MSLFDHLSPKQSCSELYSESFGIYTLTIDDDRLAKALADPKNPVSIFKDILSSYLNAIVKRIIDRDLNDFEQPFIYASHESVVIDTNQEDVKMLLPNVDDLFSDTIDHERKEMFGFYLKACQIPLASIIGDIDERYYFIFMINRTLTPAKMIFLGHHKRNPKTPAYTLIHDLTRTLRDKRVTTIYSQTSDKSKKIYRKKVALLSL